MGLKGIWIAQVVKEFLLFSTYALIVLIKDWHLSGEESKVR